MHSVFRCDKASYKIKAQSLKLAVFFPPAPDGRSQTRTSLAQVALTTQKLHSVLSLQRAIRQDELEILF